MLNVNINNHNYEYTHINIDTITNNNLLIIHNKRDYQKYNFLKFIINKEKKIITFNPYKNGFYNDFKNLLLSINTENLYNFNKMFNPEISILDDCNDFEDNDLIKITNQKIASTFNIDHFTDDLIKDFDYICLQTIHKKYYSRIFSLFHNIFNNDIEFMIQLINTAKNNDSFIIINNIDNTINWCHYNKNKIRNLINNNFFNTNNKKTIEEIIEPELTINNTVTIEKSNILKMSNDCLINPLMARNNKVVKETITPVVKKNIVEEKKLIKMSNDCLINPLMAKNNKVVKETITPVVKKDIVEEKQLIKMSNDCLINPLMAKNNKVVKETIIPTTKKVKEEKQLIKMSNDCLINPLMARNNKVVKETITPTTKKVKEEKQLIKMSNDYLINPLLIKNNKIVKKTIIPIIKEENNYEYKTNYNYINDTIII